LTKTYDKIRALKQIKKGYKLHRFTTPNIFVLRLPQIKLIDLCCIAHISDYNLKKILFEIWENLSFTLDARIDGTNIRRVTGSGLELCLVVAGPDLHELEELKCNIFNRYMQSYNICKDSLRILFYPPNTSMQQANESTINLLAILQNYYHEYVHSYAYGYLQIFNLKEFPSPLPYWKSLSKIVGTKLFVAHGCFSYGLSYFEATSDTDIAFAEIHLASDPYEIFRKLPQPKKIFTPFNQRPLSNLVIIDKSFTGKTLIELKRRFSSNFDVKTVALFPKTISAVKTADYIIIGNSLLPSAQIPITNSWCKDLILTREYK
jgi:hypothetical protein